MANVEQVGPPHPCDLMRVGHPIRIFSVETLSSVIWICYREIV